MTRQHIHVALALPPAPASASPSSTTASIDDAEPTPAAVVSGIRPSADLLIYLDVSLLISRASLISLVTPSRRGLTVLPSRVGGEQRASRSSSQTTTSSSRRAIQARPAQSATGSSYAPSGGQAIFCGRARVRLEVLRGWKRLRAEDSFGTVPSLRCSCRFDDSGCRLSGRKHSGTNAQRREKVGGLLWRVTGRMVRALRLYTR